MATDGQGDVLATGRFCGTLDFGIGPLTVQGSDTDTFLAKYMP